LTQQYVYYIHYINREKAHRQLPGVNASTRPPIWGAGDGAFDSWNNGNIAAEGATFTIRAAVTNIYYKFSANMNDLNEAVDMALFSSQMTKFPDTFPLNAIRYKQIVALHILYYGILNGAGDKKDNKIAADALLTLCSTQEMKIFLLSCVNNFPYVDEFVKRYKGSGDPKMVVDTINAIASHDILAAAVTEIRGADEETQRAAQTASEKRFEAAVKEVRLEAGFAEGGRRLKRSRKQKRKSKRTLKKSRKYRR
jgi:hypothetical protein